MYVLNYWISLHRRLSWQIEIEAQKVNTQKKSIEKLIECKTLDWIRSIATLNCTANTEIKSILLMFFFAIISNRQCVLGSKDCFFRVFFWLGSKNSSSLQLFFFIGFILSESRWKRTKSNESRMKENAKLLHSHKHSLCRCILYVFINIPCCIRRTCAHCIFAFRQTYTQKNSSSNSCEWKVLEGNVRQLNQLYCWIACGKLHNHCSRAPFIVLLSSYTLEWVINVSIWIFFPKWSTR